MWTTNAGTDGTYPGFFASVIRKKNSERPVCPGFPVPRFPREYNNLRRATIGAHS
jgi:hypothetical protein